jgi:hypothetical protein
LEGVVVPDPVLELVLVLVLEGVPDTEGVAPEDREAVGVERAVPDVEGVPEPVPVPDPDWVPVIAADPDPDPVPVPDSV